MKRRQIVKGIFGNNKGFTLIEIIAVLVILAIVSAVVISRGTASDAAKLQAEVDTLKGHLRYAQALAMNDIYPVKWGIHVDSTAKSYTLVKDPPGTGNEANFLSPINLPNESSTTHSFTPITATTINVFFDDWGSPSTTSVPFGGETIIITATTGFIQ
jgi:prepilin-type N-terminal cleavage/methylation domain-containing protein